MNPLIHYTVKVKVILDDDNELKFEEFVKEFVDENPIIAREAAFKFYQSYVDVLLEAKGKKYISYRETEIALKSFLNSKKPAKITIENKVYEFSHSFGFGIGVFLNIDPLIKEVNPDDTELVIHSIGRLWESIGGPEDLLYNLEKEYEIFDNHGYEMKNLKTSVIFCDRYEWEEGFRENEPSTYTILKTPFDWTGLDQPPSEVNEPEVEYEPKPKDLSIDEIIANGETDQVEFKPSLIYNFKTDRGGIGVKHIIAKTICAFLNSKGGFLFIGVSDNRKIQGLSYDFGLSGDKNPKDYFRLEFDDIIKTFIPTSYKTNISGDFVTIDGKEVFVVTAYPSKYSPVFLKGPNGKEFWVRWTASTRQYVDIEEVANYCLNHWNYKTNL